MKKVLIAVMLIVAAIVAFRPCSWATETERVKKLEEEQFFRNFRENSIQVTVKDRTIAPDEQRGYGTVLLLTGEDKKGQSFRFIISDNFPDTRKFEIPVIYRGNGELCEIYFLKRPTKTFGEWWFDCQPGTTLYLLSDKPFVAGANKINEICQKFVFFKLKDLPSADLYEATN